MSSLRDFRFAIPPTKEAAILHPVRFQNEGYIRIGSVKKPLKEVPDRERALWRIFDQTPFEDLVAVEHAGADEVLRLLDYPAHFDLLERPLLVDRDGILRALADDDLIRPCEAGGWNITHLGAILLAKRLEEFRALRRKAPRVIQYRGAGRVETLREQVIGKGYANGFEGLIDSVNGLLPSTEVIGKTLRLTAPRFPRWRCGS